MAKKKRSQDSKRRTKKNSSILEYEIMRIMEASLKSVISTAIDSIFNGWEKQR